MSKVHEDYKATATDYLGKPKMLGTGARGLPPDHSFGVPSMRKGREPGACCVVSYPPQKPGQLLLRKRSRVALAALLIVRTGLMHSAPPPTIECPTPVLTSPCVPCRPPSSRPFVHSMRHSGWWGHTILVGPDHPDHSLSCCPPPSRTTLTPGVGELLTGTLTPAEQQPDADLGKSLREGFRNTTRAGDENRSFGIPTIRTDVRLPKLRSVANTQVRGVAVREGRGLVCGVGVAVLNKALALRCQHAGVRRVLSWGEELGLGLWRGGCIRPHTAVRG